MSFLNLALAMFALAHGGHKPKPVVAHKPAPVALRVPLTINLNIVAGHDNMLFTVAAATLPRADDQP